MEFKYTYRHSDLAPLNGAIRALESIDGMPEIEITYTGKAFTLLALAEDVPPPLRRYYAQVGKKLTDTAMRLKKILISARYQGWKLNMRINSKLDSLELNEEDMNRLRYVNNRLVELEKSLKQKTDGMRERLKGLDPSGVEWDEWDSTKIILRAEIGTESDRPTYDPDAWTENGEMEPIQISARIYQSWKLDAREEKKPWGLDDGQDHSDMGGCEGHPMQHFNQCYLFHELFDHAGVGLRGMLHLRSLWIEVMPHRSGDFVI